MSLKYFLKSVVTLDDMGNRTRESNTSGNSENFKALSSECTNTLNK